MKKHLSAIGLTLLLSNYALAGFFDLFLNNDQKAHRLLLQGKAGDAARRFKNRDWRAGALYRQGRYEDAAHLYGEIGGTEQRFNQGNAFAQLGQFDKAIKAYEAVLKENPKHRDAQFNLALVKKLQQKQSESQSQSQSQSSQTQSSQQQTKNDTDSKASQKQNSPSSEQEKQNQGPSNTSEPEQNQAEKPQQPDASQSSENKRQEKQKLAEQKAKKNNPSQPLSRDEMEKLQANQQWLKRIQDEPNNLLRQKFLRDYVKRKRQGGRLDVYENPNAPPW